MAFKLSFRKELGLVPVTEAALTGPMHIYAERYLFPPGLTRDVRASSALCLLILLDGAEVREGESERWRTSTLPGQSILAPIHSKTHWQFSGAADGAVFYILPPYAGVAARLFALSQSLTEPKQFNDLLVGSTARYILHEIQMGSSCDASYVAMLVEIMLEQCFRTLSTPDTRLFSPRHIHFNRLQRVLTFIHGNLTADLSVGALSALSGTSETHFRRLFHEAVGVSVHRYVQAARLQQARNLLGTSSMPIVDVASTCGFANQSHLTAHFRTTHGVTPAAYRKAMTR